MKYLKIILNGPTEVKAAVLEALRTATAHEPVIQNGELYLQLHDQADMISEVFSLGVSFAELSNAGIDDPFDFEIVTATELPLEVAMKLN